MPKLLITAFLMAAAAALAGCSPAGEVETRTETIEPAAPPPGVASDDPGLTQTTEIGEERSPSEGGILAGEVEQPVTTTTGSPPPARKKE